MRVVLNRLAIAVRTSRKLLLCSDFASTEGVRAGLEST